MEWWEYVVVSCIAVGMTIIGVVVYLGIRAVARGEALVEVKPTKATFLLNAEEAANVEQACLSRHLTTPTRKAVKWSSTEGGMIGGVGGAALVTSIEVRTDGDEVTLRINYYEVEPVTWRARKDGE